MKHHFQYIIAAAAALCPVLVSAQDLSTEVLVDRTVSPEEKAAIRPSSLSPVLSLPRVDMPSLQPARYTYLSPITRSYARLDPANGALAAEKSPWRGYAALGYFPLKHGNATVGYRLLDTDKFILDASVQGEASENHPVKKDPRKLGFYDVRAGVGGSWMPGQESSLDFKVGYDFLNQKSIFWEMQTINYVDAAAAWSSKSSSLDYNVSAQVSFEMPGNTIIHVKPFKPSADVLFYQPYQQQYKVKGSASYGFAGTSRAGIDLEANIVHTGNCVYNKTALSRGGSAGYAAVTPHYSISTGNLYASVGIRVNLGVGGFSGKRFRIAPDINIQWAPGNVFSLWARADGGECIATNHDLRQFTPYQIFIYESENSNIPYRVSGAINIKPAKGLSFSVGGGYAKAKKWLMFSNTIPSFASFDISGWNVNAAISYEWKFVKASVEAMYAPGDYKHAWLDNRDRARLVAGATIEANPLQPLTVGVEYRGRLDRNCYTYMQKSYSLGDVCDVNAYASWRFNDRFTVFGRCENILGHTYLVVAQVLSEKQTGAVGIEVKF